MNELDYAVVALVAISVIVGILRGAAREVIHLAGWVLAFILSHAYAHALSIHFADWMTEPIYRVIVAWLAIFLSVMVISSLLASLVSELVRKLGLGGLNRTFGGIIGLLRGGLVLLVLTLAAGMTKFPQSALWKTAATTPWLEVAALHARTLLPESLTSRIIYRSPKLQQAQAGQKG